MTTSTVTTPSVVQSIRRMRFVMGASSTASTRAGKRRAPTERGRIVEIFFDAQQLVVLRDTVGASRRAGLDLAAVGRHREIGDGRVFGLAGAVRHDRGVARAVC